MWERETGGHRPWRRLLFCMLVLSMLVSILAAGPGAAGALQSARAADAETPASTEADGLWLELDAITTGLQQPTAIVTPPGTSDAATDPDLLFVLERSGRVRVIADGALQPTPFLDLTAELNPTGWEQGLLGLAFAPDYATSGAFYVVSTPTAAEWRLQRYHVSDNPLLADAASAETLIALPHPGVAHYSGALTFGPDGMLYIGIGDGEGGYDPYGNAQDLSELHGKLLRIDVTTPPADGATLPYVIPADNPFVGVPDARGEVWAYGLRNPWSVSFDRDTGDLWIADVGEATAEEVNVQPADSTGGQNYGWPLLEGTTCSPAVPTCNPDPALYTMPVLTYGRDSGCSITGGYVARHASLDGLSGQFLFGDFCDGTIWSTSAASGWARTERLQTPLQISAFGEDASGQQYVADYSGGGIYRLSSTTTPPPPSIISVQPDVKLLLGSMPCTLDVYGWNFAEDIVVTIDGQPRVSEVVDARHVRVGITADDLATAGDRRLQLESAATAGDAGIALNVVDAGPAGAAFIERWARADAPVADGAVARTWMWGPQARSCALAEMYAEGTDGYRWVQYFDKSRMEVTLASGNPDDLWYVTNGLLVVEMVTGEMQTGHNTFTTRRPANVPIAGDPDDLTGPTYATMAAVLAPVPQQEGQTITSRIARDGTVSEDPALATHNALLGTYDAVTGHHIAAPLENALAPEGPIMVDGQLTEGPLVGDVLYATGRPISEPYWAAVKVAGTVQDVLIQCFERRCLTWTPGNDPAWQVEAGNVGQHYWTWRYGN